MPSWLRSLLSSRADDAERHRQNLPPRCPSCPGAQRAAGVTWEALKRNARAGCFWCNLFENIVRDMPAISSSYSDGAPDERKWAWDPVSGIFGRQSGSTRTYEIVNASCIRIYTLEGDSSLAPVIRPRSHGYPHWDLPSCVTTAKAWLQECETSHNCLANTNFSGFVPHRLLDLQADSCSSGVRLVEVEGAGPSAGYVYACLSYCWGQGTHHCMTTDDTLELHKREIAWSNIPALFQDVIKFARAMGIRYLWIDSVCIIQGNAEDWQREAGLMAEVYSNAVMTIATTRAPDVKEGLFLAPQKLKNEKYFGAREIAARHRGQAFRLFAHNCYPHDDLTFSYDRPLLQRAWVFQERFLSPRVLHFCLEELQWECRAGTVCQCVTPVEFHSCEKSIWNQNSQRDNPTGGPPIEHPWHKIVQRYTSLKLTFGKDRLPAISGVAKQTDQFRAGEIYLAGIWKCDLPWALGWVSRAETLKKRPARAEWFAPTWSWASVNDDILWSQWSRAPDQQYTTLTGHHQHSGPEMLGRVCRECWISVSGVAASARLKFKHEGEAEDQSTYSLQLGDAEFGLFLADFRLFEPDEFCVPDPQVHCILLSEVDSAWTFLILCPTKGNPEVYQRIGVVSYHSEMEPRPLSFFECASERSFMII